MNEIVTKTEDNVKNHRPVSSILKTMEIGTQEVYPITQLNSIRKIIVDCQLMDEKKFSTRTENRTVIVTRVK